MSIITPGRILTGLATLAGAAMAGATAIANSLMVTSPLAASAMPIANGQALARAARMDLVGILRREQERATHTSASLFPSQIPEATRARAMAAYKMEPLASQAITVLALADASRDPALGRTAFRLLHRLTKRDEAAVLWLAQDAAKRSDIPGTLIYFDEVLRTSSEARPLLLRNFAVATSDPQFRAQMARLVAAKPPWAGEFWTQAAEAPQAAAAVAELRMLLAGTTVKFDKQADQKIANSLISQGRYELAQRLYESTRGKPDRSTVKNADFASESVMPPVDWETYSIGDFGSEISPSDGILAAYATKAPGGVVARQWIVLNGTTHRVRVNSRIFGKGAGDEAALVISCLEGGKQVAPQIIVLADGQTDRDFRSSPDCRNYWLDIRITPGDRSNGVDVEFDQISIANPGS